MSKFAGYEKYCLIDPKNNKANCMDKYDNIATTCTRVKDNVKTFYNNTELINNEILKIARDPNIDYNYFRASR
jgi:hypothetical protein